MPQRKLDDWIAGFLTYMENSEPPQLFKLWSALCTIAAVLQRKCWVNWEKKIYPNMYVVLVGPSGSRKGTAMGPCLDLLLGESSVRLAAEATTREALIRKLKNCNVVDMVKSGPAQRHASVTIWSQELATFLGYNNPQFLSDLTDWYDCRDMWTYETKGQGIDEIHGVWVNLFGATTPSTLQASLPMSAVGGGLTSRIIFVYGDKKSKIVDVPIRTPAEEALYYELSYDLSEMAQLSGEFRMTGGYLEKRIAWRRQQELQPPMMDHRFEGYLTRRATHLLKISMILSASRGDDMLLDEDVHERSLKILEATEAQMNKVFRGYGLKSEAVLFPQLMNDIAMAGTIPFNILLERFMNDIDKTELASIIQTFEKIGFCKTELSNGQVLVIHNKKGQK